MACVLGSRLARRESPFVGDATSHLGHRMLARGRRPRSVVFFVAAVTALAGAGSAVMYEAEGPMLIAAWGARGLGPGGRVAGPAACRGARRASRPAWATAERGPPMPAALRRPARDAGPLASPRVHRPGRRRPARPAAGHMQRILCRGRGGCARAGLRTDAGPGILAHADPACGLVGGRAAHRPAAPLASGAGGAGGGGSGHLDGGGRRQVRGPGPRGPGGGPVGGHGGPRPGAARATASAGSCWRAWWRRR